MTAVPSVCLIWRLTFLLPSGSGTAQPVPTGSLPSEPGTWHGLPVSLGASFLAPAQGLAERGLIVCNPLCWEIDLFPVLGLVGGRAGPVVCGGQVVPPMP